MFALKMIQIWHNVQWNDKFICISPIPSILWNSMKTDINQWGQKKITQPPTTTLNKFSVDCIHVLPNAPAYSIVLRPTVLYRVFFHPFCSIWNAPSNPTFGCLERCACHPTKCEQAVVIAHLASKAAMCAFANVRTTRGKNKVYIVQLYGFNRTHCHCAHTNLKSWGTIYRRRLLLSMPGRVV